MPRLLVSANALPPLALLVAGVANVVATMPSDMPNVVVTHAWDGQHKSGTLHKKLAAIDFRTKNLTSSQKVRFFAALRLKFPMPRFDVLFEDEGTDNEHGHLEDNDAKGRPDASL